MTRRLARRLVSGTVTLLVVSIVVFALIHLAPGSPLEELSLDDGSRAWPPDQVEALRHLYRLDEPLHRRYLLWLGDVLHGDLGLSFHDRRPVAEKIAERLGLTLTVNTLALGVIVLLALPLGLAAAWSRGGVVDRISGPLTYALYALPVFWVALLFQTTLSARLGWFPLYGARSDWAAQLGPLSRLGDELKHLVLPVACLSYGGLAYVSPFVRNNLLESTQAESMRAARARGLPPARLVAHALRQAALPLLTLAGLLLPRLVAGSVIVETIFALPGLGRLFLDAALQRDVPVVMAVTLLTGSATLAGIVAADLAYAIADPRVRRG